MQAVLDSMRSLCVVLFPCFETLLLQVRFNELTKPLLLKNQYSIYDRANLMITVFIYLIGIYPTKYEWAGLSEKGDCSLKILDANLEYDDGVWQCQVTPSSFQSKDSLISEGAELVVRGKR